MAETSTVAVLNFTPAKILSQSINPEIDIDATLSAHIAHNLVESNHFTVIDPAYINSVKKQIKRTNISTAQAYQQLGALLNAHYVISGVIETLTIKTNEAIQPYTNVKETIRSGRMTINVSVVNAQTGAIIASILVNTDKHLVLDPAQPMTEDSFIFALEGDAASNIAIKITDAIFPPRIMQVNGDTVFIDRGTNSNFIPGDLLIAYQQGSAMIDPDSGKPFGFNTKNVGTIKVTTLKRDYTLASIITGNPTDLIKAIVTKAPEEEKPVNAMQSNTTGSNDQTLQW